MGLFESVGLNRGFTVSVTRGIEWSLRVFASMPAVRQFIFASTSTDQFSHTSSELFMTGRKNRALQEPPVVPYKALGNFYKLRAASTSQSFRQLESLFIKTLFCANQVTWLRHPLADKAQGWVQPFPVSYSQLCLV